VNKLDYTQMARIMLFNDVASMSRAAASGLLCVSAVLATLIVMPREESVQLWAPGTNSGTSKADRLNPLHPDASANAGLNPALARALAAVTGPLGKATAGAQTDSLYQHEKLAQVQQVIALEKRIQHQFSQLQVPSQKSMSVLGNGGSAPRQVRFLCRCARMVLMR
jgi:hypothetical protein